MTRLTADRRISLTGNTDTDWLKLIALVFMMIDHSGLALFGNLTEMRILGRIAMPIYVWCLVVGSEYTHNIWRYALRLLVMAVISQPFNMVALGNPWSKLNILFQLAMGVACIGAIKEKRYFSQFWVPALCFMLHGFVSIDYGWKGLAFILLMYAARKSRGALAAGFLAFAAFWGSTGSQINAIAGLPLTFLAWPGVGQVLQPLFKMQALMWLALPFILIPTRTGFKMPKWLGYGFYPLHLLVIIILKLWMSAAPSGMFSTLWTFH